MSITAQQLREILDEQQAKADERFAAMLERLMPQQERAYHAPAALQPTLESLSNSITEFSYAPEDDVTFEAWFKRYESLFREDAALLEDSAKVRLLLRKMHTSVHDKFANFILPKTSDQLSFAETVDTLKCMFGPQASLFNVRYKCLKTVKRPADDYVSYGATVNKECERFQLGALTPDQFKCLIFVCGLQSSEDASIRMKLLDKIESDPEVTLTSITAECNRIINLRHDANMVATGLAEPSHKVSIVRAKQFQSGKAGNAQKRMIPGSKTNSSKPRSPCWLCGSMHFVRECEFQNHTCMVCHRTGHKEGFCDVRKFNGNKPKRFVSKNQPRANGVHAVSSLQYERYNRFVTISLDERDVRFQVDTGSELTILTTKTWKDIGAPPLDDAALAAVSVTCDPVPFVGRMNCTARYQSTDAKLHCFVCSKNSTNLLGAEWLTKLGVYPVIDSLSQDAHCDSARVTQECSPSISATSPQSDSTVQDLCVRYPSVYDTGLGHCSKAKAALRLRPDATPVFRPKRPVPFAAQAAVDAELDRLEGMGVISKVDYSRWAAPIVVVKKANGSLRICADFSTGLNDALELHRYPLPLPEDIFATLNGGRVFSQLDFADAYLQIEMEEEDKELLTINTHRGLYRYNRLPFGVKSAPGIFQQIMDTMLAGLQGTVAYLDDVIVVGHTEDEHRRNLDAVFKRIEEFGFHIRLEKCHFFMPCVKYLGCIIDKDGRRPNPAKIEAITRMPPPTDVPTLRSFLGLLNYYGNFVKEMRELRAPMDVLLKKDMHFKWTKECQDAFERAKAILSSDLLLTHYDPNQEIIVAADASDYGIGAVIMHRFPNGTTKAVSHASRSLAAAEKNYSQIEKEALGLVYAVKKFHKMIHGRKFTLLTDHKPLLAIFGSKKGIPVHTANRLLRWATTLLAYNFSIEYTSTTTFGQADALSRLIADHTTPDEDFVVASVFIEPDVRQTFVEAVRATPVTTSAIRDATAEDDILRQVLASLAGRWPQVIADPSLKQFYNRRDALSTLDGCLMFAERVVVPRSLQRQVLRQLHTGHPGIVRMKALARSYVYWPGLDSDVETIVKQCSNCAESARLPVKTTLAPWPEAVRPWARIHIDYAGPFQGHYYLVIVDAFSKWPEVLITDRISTSATIQLLRQVFARFGMPETLVSDNGTQFTSAEFAEFCTQNGIDQVRSPPYHPQSNGQAERFVDTFKRTLLKLKGEGTLKENLETFLLSYRSTPNAALAETKTPAEALMGRRLRTPLDLMRPSTNFVRRSSKMESQFNRHHGARRRIFQRGDLVYVKLYRNNSSAWAPGRIKRRRGRVLYEVEVNGVVHKRHTNQLRSRMDADLALPSDETLETFIETFGLEKPTPVGLAEQNDFEDNRLPDVRPIPPDAIDQEEVVNSPTPRRSHRRRRPPRRLVVDPSQKRYDSS